jgi:hypothetical protein
MVIGAPYNTAAYGARKSPKGPRWKPKHQRFTEDELRPYALAVGQVALAWNDLYEIMAQLFCTLSGGGWVSKHLAVWHSQTMDRPKRELLRATVEYLTADEEARFPKMRESVIWIADEAQRLEDARNNTVHLPLVLLRGGALTQAARERGIKVPDVMVHTLNNHPRAKRMLQKNLLGEFRRCRAKILALRDFTYNVDRALCAAHAPWPDIPGSPNPRAKSGPQGKVQSRPKQHPPRPKPSPA